MPPGDTLLGAGQPSQFPATAWSLVAGAREGDPPDRRRNLGRLLELYWRPIYCYIGRSWAQDNEAAKDLTQAFLLHVLEDNVVAKFAPQRGRFRAFLKAALKNFLAQQHEARHRLKRGGHALHFSMEVADGTIQDALAGASSSPDAAFDRQWVEDLFREAFARVEERFRREGKESWLATFQRYEMDSNPDHPEGYRDVARALQIKESDVPNYLRAVRAAVRKEIRALVSDTVCSEDDLYEELRALLE